MSRVHDVLRWANRRAVAEEVTRRGYRVSGETLNRWVRDKKEFPAIVERVVFDLFTIEAQQNAAPELPERLVAMEGMVRLIALQVGVQPELVEEMDRRVAELTESQQHNVGGHQPATPPSRDGPRGIAR